jgi:protein dithiol oxidoreductase (disulfide-forming)
MKRRPIASGSALVAAALLSFATLNACARAGDVPSKWQPGTNYTQLEAPQAPTAATGKVEVLEIFWYGCGHCFALDPALESWKAGKPAYVEFTRMPVMWGPAHAQHAKLFYTLRALKRDDLHPKVFAAIHEGGQMLASPDEVAAREMHQKFLTDNGVSLKDFNAAYDSMSVATQLKRAENLTRAYQVASVPIIIVNGKYSTGVSLAGGTPQLLSLINDLAASEKGR